MLHSSTKLHFIGIGGIGVSAVARLAIARGHSVSGSDVRASQLTDAMRELGAHVSIGHDASHIDGRDLVVTSTAIPDHNVELSAARERGVPLIHRSELLAQLISESRSVGVTGTHGKGTTCAMLVGILDAAGMDPGFIIGGLLNNYGVNARAGSGEVMVAEVDESDGTHKNVPTRILVCNYLEADHLNYYEDLEDIIASMRAAVERNSALEALFVNGDCPGNRRMAAALSRPAITYGVETPNNYRARLLDGGQLPIRFTVDGPDGSMGDFSIPLPGRYNVVNATGAIAVADYLGVPVEAMRQGLAAFRGLENRFTIADAGGVTIVKDYNSHPTAIRKVLESAKDLTQGATYSVFKPYRYTLTSYLQDEYATAFAGSTAVIITTMYAAGEDPIPGVDTAFVVQLLRDQGMNVIFVPDQTEITATLQSLVAPGDTVLFFGGDDFFEMADEWCDARNGVSNP